MNPITRDRGPRQGTETGDGSLCSVNHTQYRPQCPEVLKKLILGIAEVE